MPDDPRIPGGRYFSGYWHHEYIVDATWYTVHWSDKAQCYMPGVQWFAVTWVPSEDAINPRASSQWRGEGYRKGSHCTAWDEYRDEIVKA